VKDVPPGATVVGIPARIAARRRPEGAAEFVAYGTPTDDLPDPVARALTDLAHQVDQVNTRLEALEQERGRTGLAELALEPKHEDAKRRQPAARAKN
jgi:serine O-acetyltransferase